MMGILAIASQPHDRAPDARPAGADDLRSGTLKVDGCLVSVLLAARCSAEHRLTPVVADARSRRVGLLFVPQTGHPRCDARFWGILSGGPIGR